MNKRIRQLAEQAGAGRWGDSVVPAMMYKQKRRRCCNCNMLTLNWQRVNGGPWHCYDGCKSTTGWDHRLQHLGVAR